MNWKPTWVLLAAAAVVLAFIVWVEQPLRLERERQASRIILPGFDPALVTNIEIKPSGESLIQAVRQNSSSNSWHLTRPVDYPAQSQFIEALLDALAKLEWVDHVTEKELKGRPNAQKEFGFNAPRFTLLLQGSGPERSLEIGDLGVFNDRVSLQVVGNNTIYQIATDILKWIPQQKDGWRDTSLLELTNLSFQTLQVRAAGNEFDLERDATNHLWFMLHPLHARADTPKINDLLARLQTLSVGAFISDNPQADLDPYGLRTSDTTPGLTLSFLNGTNLVAGLQMGTNLTNFPDLVFARRNDPSNIVVIAREPLKAWQSPYTNFLDQHFISLSPSMVESITVQGEDDFVVRRQTNGLWLVTSGKSFPADATLMEYWLASLTNVPTEIVKTVVTDFSPYGLNTHPALQYTVRFAAETGAGTEARIEFGTNQMGNVFERRLGEDPVNTISPGEFARLPCVSWQLRDRQVWIFEASNVMSITVHQLGGTIKYLRDPEGNWTYAPGFNSQVGINSPALEECVVRLSRLRAIYWDGEGNPPQDRFGFAKTSHELEIEVKHDLKKEIFRIQFGERSPFFHPYASVLRDGQRLIFEFPGDLYQNLIEPYLSLFTARFRPH